jgi:hypothetical protein
MNEFSGWISRACLGRSCRSAYNESMADLLPAFSPSHEQFSHLLYSLLLSLLYQQPTWVSLKKRSQSPQPRLRPRSTPSTIRQISITRLKSPNSKAMPSRLKMPSSTWASSRPCVPTPWLPSGLSSCRAPL